MGDLQQQLQALLETETSITSTWLANNLRITVNAACQALELYLSSHLNDVHASYLITGYDKNNNLQIAVVSSEDVGTFKTEALKKILSTKIFSIEKSASESLRSQIVDSCLQLADSLLKETSAVEDSFLTNTSGDITLKGLSVKSVGERIFSSQNLQYTKSLSSNPSVSSTTSKTETKVGKTSMESNQHEKTQSFFAKTSSSSSASATQPTKSTPTNAFFAVSSTTANPKGAISSQSSDDHFEVLQAPSKPKSKSTTQSRLDDDDEEWDDGEAPTVGHKRLNSSQEKAKPALEDSEDEEPLSAGTEHHEIPTAKKPKVGKSQNLTVRGAMDDFMEDVAIEQFKQEQAEMKNNEKKRNKVLVEKVIYILGAFI
jgi:hypothetical protein